MDQARESDLTDEQRAIAELIIGNIDDYGYLKATVEEIAAANNLPAEKIAEVLKVIQTFDPSGVGARDLRECLMLQLERAGQQESLEYRIVRDFMEALGKRRIPEIARGTGRDVEEVQDALAASAGWSRGLDARFCRTLDQYVAPEVFVQKVWRRFHRHDQRRTTSRIFASATFTKTSCRRAKTTSRSKITSAKKSAPENFSSRACTSGSRRSRTSAGKSSSASATSWKKASRI